MLAFLSQKANPTETHQYTAVSWNKDTDMFIAGRSDGMVIMRQLDAKTRAARAAAKGAGGEAARSDEQNLINHQAPIRSIAWNPRHNTVATGDVEGIATVWKLDPKTGLWSNYMATRAVQRAVEAMQWTKEGDRICIVYETGTVMVGKIDGVKLWSVEQKQARVPAWSADGEIVLIGTSLGQIFIYDKAANNIGLVTLTSKPEEKPSEQPLVDIKWYYPNDGVTTYHPVLAIAFADGKLYLLQGEEDHHPIWVNVPMTIVCMDWSADGKSIAIAGRTRKTVAAPEESAQLMVYSLYGKPEYTMRFRSKNLTGLSWDSSGQRLAVVLDGALNFVVIKRPIKFCVFENTLVYSCAKDEAPDALLVMYSLKNEKRVAVKHYTNQRVLSLCGGNDFCAISTRVTADGNQMQFNLYVLNDTGATINISFTNIEPAYIAANDSQIFVASKEVLFVWSFRLSGAVESVSSRWETNERYFHVDDAHGFIDLKQKRQRLYEVSVDPICAITASRTVLIVARESGALVRYSLPQMIWEREYPSILPAPRKLGLNKNSSRLLVMNYVGQCAMYALEEIYLSKDAQPVKDVRINLEKRDIWDFMWAEDDPEMFVVNHKSRSIVYRNRDAEEPIANEGYLCKFKDLEIKVGFLDDIIRQAVPTDPPPNCTRTLRTKALRETHQLMDTGNLVEAQHFVEMNPHSVLWNLIANRAVQRLDLDLAELCYIRGENYSGIQFVNRLRKSKSDHLRKADVAAYFGDHYRAEQEYNDANRADLSADLRRISGDWFRLKEMAVDNENDMLLKESYIGLGNYYYDRQAWPEAIKNYEAARDYNSLYKCYMLNGDTQKLEELADLLPTGHSLLVEIGRLLGNYGDSVAAARILRKAEQTDLAVEVCIKCYNFQTAAELARTYDLEKHTPTTVSQLMNQAIQEQVIGQGDENSLWSAANLYYNSSLYLEAAKCLFQILEQEIARKESDYLRLKKLGVLAAVAVEEYRKGNTKLLDKSTKHELLQEETKSADYPFLDNPWRIPEAYNVMLVAQTFQAQGDYKRALRAAGTLCTYTDVMDPVPVYSMIALSATSLKRWDVVNEAILRIVNMPNVDASTVKEMEEFADDLFAKHSPKDVDLDDPLPSPLCLNCSERLPIWDIKCTACSTKYPICMATGSPITEAEVWQCEVCHHHCAASAALHRKVCALCHTAR